MSTQQRRSFHCAIYTRKSSEEGLEQSFNSLDAQREACHAYIQSQRQEGWRAIETHYDDGGYSGGTMERPALKQLLADIEARKIDVVVVYKVDRLTRSLADFAKIIEVFDARGASFVSVTQQFNTTSSMGRLTLNVLLSFAQFEREVTGERIRDKIAASKRKGMWMGGAVPIGYDLKDRHLSINEREAEQVREIFHMYLKLGCVKKLKAHLDSIGAKGKLRTSRIGRTSGGHAFARGGLYKLLQNRIYLGEIEHKDQVYPGQHEPIIDRELWEQVRSRMAEGIRDRRHGRNTESPSLLRGLLCDEEGNRYTPSHAVKRGVRYRYYVSEAVIKDAASNAGGLGRIPAREVEKVVIAELKRFLNTPGRVVGALSSNDDVAVTRCMLDAANQLAKTLDACTTYMLMQLLSEIIARIVVQVHNESIEIHVYRDTLRARLLGEKVPTHDRKRGNVKSAENSFILSVSLVLKRQSGELRLIVNAESERSDPGRVANSALKAIARATGWVQSIVSGEYGDQRALATALGVNERYVSHIISGAFLAPDIVEAITQGKNLSERTLNELFRNIPVSWEEQRSILLREH